MGRVNALPVIHMSEESSHLIHTFPHKVDRGVTVQIHSDLNSRMYQNIAESLDIDSAFNGSCCEGMPQGMKICVCTVT